MLRPSNYLSIVHSIPEDPTLQETHIRKFPQPHIDIVGRPNNLGDIHDVAKHAAALNASPKGSHHLRWGFSAEPSIYEPGLQSVDPSYLADFTKACIEAGVTPFFYYDVLRQNRGQPFARGLESLLTKGAYQAGLNTIQINGIPSLQEINLLCQTFEDGLNIVYRMRSTLFYNLEEMIGNIHSIAETIQSRVIIEENGVPRIERARARLSDVIIHSAGTPLIDPRELQEVYSTLRLSLTSDISLGFACTAEPESIKAEITELRRHLGGSFSVQLGDGLKKTGSLKVVIDTNKAKACLTKLSEGGLLSSE